MGTILESFEMNGIIGTFHSKEVVLIDKMVYDCMNEGEIDKEKIYAVVSDNGILLVFQNRWIGTMDENGKVQEFFNTKKYLKDRGKKKEEGKEREKKKAEEKREKVERKIVVPSVDDLLRIAIEDKIYEEIMF